MGEMHKIDKERNSIWKATRQLELRNSDQDQERPKQCICGNYFMDDSIFCRKCGKPRFPAQVLVPSESDAGVEGEKEPAQVCVCGNTFIVNAAFCEKCGKKRPAR